MRTKPLILVVDDEESFREIFSLKLRSAGFDVDTAKDEAETLKKSKEIMPDLILMDIYMPPGPTGTDIALNIKQSQETKDLRVAFLTNLKEPWPAISGDHKKISQELGMEDFLEKTGDLDVLVKRVNEIISRPMAGQGVASITLPPAPPVAPSPQ